jgi:tetratricopeptide (TPR) repeat protein
MSIDPRIWNRQTDAALKSAIQQFERAIAKDPHYARAHAGISDCYRLLEMWGALSPEEAVPLAKNAALKALELDPSLPEARCALATLKATYEWDWSASEREFQRVFEQQPDHSIAHQAYGMMCLAPQGRTAEAIRELKIARDLDPLGLWVHGQLSFALLLAGHYQEAIEQCRKTLELDDRFYMAHMLLGITCALQGKLKPALQALQKAHKRGGDNPRLLGWLGYVHGRAGARKRALGILEELEGLAKSRNICPAETAKVYLGLGDTAQTLKRLEEAAERRFGRMVWAIVDPIYDPIRSEPAFLAIRTRMNLR